jgi:hypothetical protein
VSEEKEKVKVPVEIKEGKYPFFEDTNLDITRIGEREKGRVIYISGRFIKSEEGEKYIQFERVNEFSVKLDNAKIVVTEKGTVTIKYEPNAELYIIELPSGYRGYIENEILSGECNETKILRSPRGSLGTVKHIWCNSNAEIQYKIRGRTITAGYGRLTHLFGESLSGKVIVKDGKVSIKEDEELDNLLS